MKGFFELNPSNCRAMASCLGVVDNFRNPAKLGAIRGRKEMHVVHSLSLVAFLTLSSFAIANASEKMAAFVQEPGGSAQQAVQLASEHLKSSRYSQAIAELKKALARDPRSSTAHMLLGFAYRAQGSYEMIGEAKAELRQALALDPNLHMARFYLARIYLDLGRRDSARQELETALRASPKVPQFLALLAEVYRVSGNPAEAIRLSTQALEADPSFAVAHYYRGMSYLDLKRKEEAVQEIEKALDSGQMLPDIYLALGSIHLEAGRPGQAIGWLEKAIGLDPGKTEARVKLARGYRLQGQLDRALDQLRHVVPEGQSFLSSVYFQELRSEAFFEMGSTREAQGERSQAIEAYREAIELDDRNGPAHRQLATLLLEQAQYEEARPHVERAKELGTPVDAALLDKKPR
jgi:tetratricopeptide (TPR) repeat protein